ncbi:MAG: ribonuclease III [Candidatus Blackburnbacteria bacterium]|nr:ribonuclease III [Candidatus Blackburnbacteria bacterium]
MDSPNEQPSVEQRLGITFKDKGLLHRAFVHRSYLNENKNETESNERLEFLGDAVLEFVVSEHLFVKFPNQDEGHLTALRSRLVNTTSLAETARELGAGEALFLSRGEEQSGGRTNRTLLANTLEAIIGAIFIDQGVGSARDFIDRFIIKKIPETMKTSLKDPKSLLQEFVQANSYPAPIYRVLSEEGPDHAKEFTVEVWIDKKPYAIGRGSSKKTATQSAAEEALKIWNHGK